jgi:hypothetical protein
MAINKSNLVKWIKMMSGRSKLHVNQGLGKNISKKNVLGYYNDLREKVKYEKKIRTDQVPLTQIENGKEVFFPTAIFQYGLGAYDLYLESNNDEYLERFITSAKWALNNQNPDGSWLNFYFSQPEHPYSCMSQGEGSSLLIRAFNKTKDKRYLDAAKNALDFMLKNLVYKNEKEVLNKELILMEYTNKSVVLNGWIFGIFGLFDYVIETKDALYENILHTGIKTIKKYIDKFDSGKWTFYNIDRTIIASRFYHKLHIAQLEALYFMTEEIEFKQIYTKWKEYDKSIIKRAKAFMTKVVQKIKE